MESEPSVARNELVPQQGRYYSAAFHPPRALSDTPTALVESDVDFQVTDV